MNEQKKFEKLLKVIKSCKNNEQLKVAYRYFKLYKAEFPEWQWENNKSLQYVDGWCIGFFEGRLIYDKR